MDHTTVDRREREYFELPEEYAGYEVCDPEGEKIGRVKKVFSNEDNEPEYIRVSLGFLGLRSALIPVQSVRVNEERKRLVLE